MVCSLLKCFIVAALSTLIFFLLSIRNKCTLPAKPSEKWLILFAHPDDETMFFAPTLINLASIGSKVHLLSITSGNSEKLGPTRIKELFAAAHIYGIPKSRVHFLDSEERYFPDGFYRWDVFNLSSMLLSEINRIKPNGIVTFDHNGISGHPNHEDCFRSLKLIGTNLTASHLFALRSVSLWRKYSTFFELFYLAIFGGDAEIALSTDPITIYRAMAEHRSQMVWFRYLYMAFSRYIYANTFVEIT